MTISFNCPCGQQYAVPSDRAGKTATCSNCMSQLRVPQESTETVPALPPKRKRKKRSSQPELSKTTPDGHDRSQSPVEMQPIVVVLIALCLLYHGNIVLKSMIWLPITAMVQSEVRDALSDPSPVPDAQLSPQTKASMSQWMNRFFISRYVYAIGHLVSAASMIGVLLWHRHAVYLAAGAAALLILNQFLLLEIRQWVVLNAAAVTTIICVLKFADQRVWRRLMSGSDSPTSSS